MQETIPVLFPLVNPNEPEAVIADLFITEGQRVAKGDLLCVLETTKSTAEVTSEVDGFVTGLRYQRGQPVQAGEILCYLAEEAIHKAPISAQDGTPDVPPGLRITQPALALARARGLGLGQLPSGALVTESMVRSFLEEKTSAGERRPEQIATRPDFAPPSSPFEAYAILVYGGGGHGKMVIELLRATHTYRIAGILDDRRATGERILDVPVIGGADQLPRLAAEGYRLAVNAVGGIGNIGIRIAIFNRLAGAGFACPAIVHPAAFIEPSAELSPGAQIFAHAYVGSSAQIGYGTIINTGAIVSHDCHLGSYVNLSPGAILAGEVHVGDGALIGMGVTVNLSVKIGAGARLGNGATVKEDVPEGAIVRAGAIWPL